MSANASATGIETDSETLVEESSLSISASNDGIAFAKDWSVDAEGADDDVDRRNGDVGNEWRYAPALVCTARAKGPRSRR